jgi:hypothetical protein
MIEALGENTTSMAINSSSSWKLFSEFSMSERQDKARRLTSTWTSGEVKTGRSFKNNFAAVGAEICLGSLTKGRNLSGGAGKKANLCEQKRSETAWSISRRHREFINYSNLRLSYSEIIDGSWGREHGVNAAFRFEFSPPASGECPRRPEAEGRGKVFLSLSFHQTFRDFFFLLACAKWSEKEDGLSLLAAPNLFALQLRVFPAHLSLNTERVHGGCSM